jgi:RNA polymerase sigma-70 factor (ECF subfamily)
MAGADAVEAWLVEGQRRYPDVELAADAFRAAAAPHAAAADAAGILGADLFLATACARGDESALRRFDADYLAKIPHWLKLPPGDHDVVAEVRQRVASRALVGKDGAAPRIALYAGRGPLWAWVRIIALREHARPRNELGRRSAIEASDDDELDQLARSSELSAELLALRARYQSAMMASFRAAIAARPAKDRTLLRLVYVDALALDVVGRMYGVNKSTVSRWLATIRAELLDDAGHRLRAELGIPAGEIESLLGLMPRDLDVSLDGLLRA